MSNLALLGGPKAIAAPLKPYSSLGPEEADAVRKVMESGVLSGYVGAWCPEFDGGPVVKAFEAAWAARFGVKHAIAVNSNTSGLIAALGAVGIGPGDEVIVPPYTMSATAMAPLIYGGIPVFVDIESDTYCLDVAKVRASIGPRTRAILAVDLMGHPAALAELRALADARGIHLIEDAAQAPLAREHGRFAGTVSHIGVFSLNYHKHIHTGEGGVCVTDDDALAVRLRAIRNHAENVVDPLGLAGVPNMIGFNFRMTELSAAIGIEQLKKVDRLVQRRVEIADALSAAVSELPGWTAPTVREGCRHVYYVWAPKVDPDVLGFSRDTMAEALAAEGVPVVAGYCRPLYCLPVFRDRKAIGRDGFPFTLTNRTYEPGMCPVVERVEGRELLEFAICSNEYEDREVEAVIGAIRKVSKHGAELAAYEKRRRA
jgi:perosamine synthetase